MTATDSRLSIELLRQEGERLWEETARDCYLTRSGQRTQTEMPAIHARHADIIGRRSLAFAHDRFRDASPGTGEWYSARAILEWQTDIYCQRGLAALDEGEQQWMARAEVRLPNGATIPYYRAAVAIQNSVDGETRNAIYAARSRLVDAELAPLRRERFRRERELIAELGFADGYNATFELLTGIAVTELSRACEQFIRDTQAMWDAAYPEFLHRLLNIAPTDATHADALALRGLHHFDGGFPGEAMQSSIGSQMREMGIDATAGGRIVVDSAERPGKASRALCTPVRVPDEIYLVLYPRGGQSDWSEFLHELGHGLHFANARADLSFEQRRLGDISITEGYAALFERLLHSRPWLERYTSLGDRSADFVRDAGVYELYLVRRLCAKLTYETQLYDAAVPWDALPGLYEDSLTRGTGFRYHRSQAFIDVDPRHYCARFIRARQLQAALVEALSAQFGEEWWRTPDAGAWLCSGFFGAGQSETADQVAERLGAPLSFASLTRSIEQMLAGGG